MKPLNSQRVDQSSWKHLKDIDRYVQNLCYLVHAIYTQFTIVACLLMTQTTHRQAALSSLFLTPHHIPTDF